MVEPITPPEPLAASPSPSRRGAGDQNGSASILNYNLPQSVSYEVMGLVQLDIDRNKFKPRELEPPKTSY